MCTKIVLTISIIILVYIAFQSAYDYFYGAVVQTPSDQKAIKEVTVTIPQGASTKEIAGILEEKQLISNALLFRIQSKLDQSDGAYQYGTFTLNTGMDEDEIRRILQTQGEKERGIRFTIPEGYTVDQIAQRLEEEGIVKTDEFLNAVNNVTYDYDFVKDIPESDERQIKLQGYLFPDTYEVREGASSEEIVSKMLAQFNKKFTAEYRKRAEDLGYSMDDIITIASIIEREAKVPEERPMMASVIYNRLEIDMPLGMCSTVLYALGKAGQPVRQLLTQETRVKSPYNTYVNAGLPVGPISNPGIDSIKAALYPDETDYLYFVLKDPEDGSHAFTKTYEEHLAAQNQYLR